MRPTFHAFGRLHLIAGGWVQSLAWCVVAASISAADPLIPVGAVRLEVTPTNSIRLSGYVARTNPSVGTSQSLFARALALGADPTAAVIVTVDNCAIPAAITEEVARRLERRAGVSRERLTVASTHTHTGPHLAGAIPNMFATNLPPEQVSEIESYTRFLTDQIERAAIGALANRQLARLEWSQGTVGFAKNRRTEGGPVDHDVPILRATLPDGKLRAVLINYACHCTSIDSGINRFHGDWAGTAARTLEQNHPDAVALVAIGCGADSNPNPRGTTELAEQHGRELATEVDRVLSRQMRALRQAPECRFRQIALPYQTPFTRGEWEQRSHQPGIIGYHARRWLARLDAGEKLPESLNYPVQTLVFGEDLAMVFLGGEVVVDYSLRLKRELDASRLWVNGYANDVPCYIPSRRILSEGGYEAETSLWYYDRPQRLAPAIEDLIIKTVHELLPSKFRVDSRDAEFPKPRTPPEALNSFQHSARFRVELAAAKPLVESPVAIDFGNDGRLWVCEMRDYPLGLDDQGKAGGRIKVLTDDDGDGRFDRATVFAEGLI